MRLNWNYCVAIVLMGLVACRKISETANSGESVKDNKGVKGVATSTGVRSLNPGEIQNQIETQTNQYMGMANQQRIHQQQVQAQISHQQVINNNMVNQRQTQEMSRAAEQIRQQSSRK